MWHDRDRDPEHNLVGMYPSAQPGALTDGSGTAEPATGAGRVRWAGGPLG
jgi:hypothetical protein